MGMGACSQEWRTRLRAIHLGSRSCGKWKVQGKYLEGSFPFHNTVEDGYATTSPVGVFGTNKLGLTDMGGNVWQWCSDSIEPVGRDAEMDPAIRKVIRGGSFLCDPMVCHGYRVTGRSSSTPESSTVHIGFRCARDYPVK